MQDKITIADAPECLNTNDKAMWVLGYEAAIEARGQCLHQIQEPAATEQAAWHAGLDEGRAQAAPAAVAVPDERAAFEDWATDQMDIMSTENCFDRCRITGRYQYGFVESKWKVWQARAALAATPVAAPLYAEMLAALQAVGMDAVGVGGGENTISDAARAKVETVLEKIGAPWPSSDTAAAAPVVLPEPGAAIKEVMGLIADFEREAADVGYGHGSQRLVNEKRAAIESKLRALLAGVSAPAGQAEPVLWITEESLAAIKLHAGSSFPYGIHGLLVRHMLCTIPLYLHPAPQAQAGARDADHEGPERDTLRLDYLIEAKAEVCNDETCADGYWLQFCKKDGTRWVQLGEYETARDAIDAAIAAAKGE